MGVRSRIGSVALALALAALLVVGCGGKKQAAASTTTGATTGATTNRCVTIAADGSTAARKEAKPTALLAADKTYTVTMQTNCGTFTITLDQKQSPNAAASFVSLVQKGYFDKTVFHRIVPGFVIQGGDPTATGAGGPGYETVDKPPATAAYTHGVVAMAKTAQEASGTAGSQFFVVTEADAGLPPDYAIIGTVTQGLEVVDRIGRHGDAAQQPTMLIEIQKATVATS